MRKTLPLLLLLLQTGCWSTVKWAAVPFLYREAELPPEQIVRNVPYRDDAGADGDKHRLDFFLPDPGTDPGWPVLVFVHGGGWTSGDRAYRVNGRDVYGNIGRFFAARGIGTAVISYRLQPAVEWQDQVEDVSLAVDWVRENVGRHGGDPGGVFVAGHSAGAHLATYVALSRSGVCGLIPISGAGYDLADEETYELGASRRYYERRFRNGDLSDAWKRDASPVRLAGPGAPPALILYAEGEWPSLHRQARVLNEALLAAGTESRVVEIPGEDHYRIVLTLSRDDKPASGAIETFIRETDCRS